jgi:hypothetical protein
MGKTQLSMLGTATKHEREGVDKGTKEKEQHKRGKHKQKRKKNTRTGRKMREKRHIRAWSFKDKAGFEKLPT